MCFPKLKKCFCCLSLRTGMLFICWITLLWNLCYLYDEKSKPMILKFLDKEHLVDLPDGRSFTEFSRLYYVTQIMVMAFALIGIFSNSSCCMNLLIGSETVIFVMYVFMTLYDFNKYLSKYGAKFESNEPVEFFWISVFKYYIYLIILSFYYEVSQGRDGRSQGGIIITEVAAPYAVPPSAPHPTIIVPTAPYVDSPYAVQPPHAPIITQPCNSIYPPNEFPHVVVQTELTPCAPPPYPIAPQHCVMNEKPPPYAP